eukprot:CAMPEP_0113678224 /NCGR_PEP_ID=MMETSP0038_2-20120614/9798_1 /TAXON_ID=2898 /ORGANISM="Cryptomonas paramecium" /LENGTH=112 /DNA_ID=CAMNT_0000595777 /DNA_START=92 /DNA_END=430 /DNA_ORIENTATION=+ /assembly_acc=CAM_ASM_000170
MGRRSLAGATAAPLDRVVGDGSKSERMRWTDSGERTRSSDRHQQDLALSRPHRRKGLCRCSRTATARGRARAQATDTSFLPFNVGVELSYSSGELLDVDSRFGQKIEHMRVL